MGYIFEGLKQALMLLMPPTPEIMGIIALSLTVSAAATVLAGFIAIPLGVFLAIVEFRFKRVVIAILNTAMAIPAVLIGLLVYILINRRGLFGFFGILFTPWAIILAQALLALPIITALSLSALKGIAKDTKNLAFSLGASRWQMALAVIRQGKFAFLTAIIAGFSRVIGETGMTLMVGGNIKGETRVMTTAISLETMKGNFEFGIALGIVLLLVALLVNMILQLVQGK